MLQIYAYADILFLIVGAVFFSNFIDDCMEPGMILSWPGAWIKKEQRAGGETPWYKKPIGGCIVCMTTWAIILFFVLSIVCKPVFILFGCIGIGNSFLKIVLKYSL